MKMIKYIFGILFAALMLINVGCDDNAFLEEKPSTFYTIDNIFSTSEQVDQLLIAIYAHLRPLKVNSSENLYIHNFRGRGTDMYDVGYLYSDQTFSNYSTINTVHETFYEVYRTWYQVVGMSNLALYASELPEITWASSADKAYAIAQAKFFRAFAYKILGELFGGVPIVTEITKTPRYDYERSTRVETYQFAIDDLLSIINDLPETTPAGGRIVRAAAQHNLSELYLAMGTQLADDGRTNEAQAAFASSINYANQVIDGGIYELIKARYGTRKDEQSFFFTVYQNGNASLPVDTVQAIPNYYWDMFQEGNVNYQAGNTECIWSTQINYNAYKAEDGQSRLNYPRVFGPIFRDASTTGMTGTLEDVGGRGIGSVIITMYARDIIYEGVFADDMRNSESVFRRRFKGNINTSPYYLQVVPWDVMYESADPVTNQNIQSEIWPVSCKIATDKFTGLADGEVMSHLFREDYMIRLPETILLRAEAKQRSGDKTGAAADVNLLRDRAQCAYRVTAADMDDKFDMILDERARELVYEEWRWNTLLRMGGTIAVDRIRKYAFWPFTAATLTFNYNLWPIPQTVIDTNSDVVLPQNPGWENR